MCPNDDKLVSEEYFRAMKDNVALENLDKN